MAASVYPGSFIRRRLVPGASYHKEALAKIRGIDKEALTERAACLQAEDALAEKAAQLLTSKDTTEEELRAFLASEEFGQLEAKRQKVAGLRSQTLRVAAEAYNKVDDDIQQLDREITMLEPQMAADTTMLDPVAQALKQKMLKKQEKQKQRVKIVSRKEYRELKRQHKELGLLLGEGGAVQDLQLDEVDPNEPVYCHCQRISFGQMVGCDNEDCRYEWFHLECVGLAEPPTGTWFCPECAAQQGGGGGTEGGEGGGGGGEGDAAAAAGGEGGGAGGGAAAAAEPGVEESKKSG